MDNLATADVAQRYATRHPRRRPLTITAAGLLGAAALAWLVWVMAFHGRPLVSSETVSFSIIDEHAAEATVSVVRRDHGVDASCLLRAQASDHSIVGELSFRVGPADPANSTLTRTVRTEREATTVFLVGCVADGQSQRR